MASNKRRRVDDEASDQGSEIIDTQSARSDFRQTNGKRSRLLLAQENGGSVVSDEEDGDNGNYNYSYTGAGEDLRDEDSNDDEDNEEVDEIRASQHVLKQLKEFKENMPQEQGIIEEVFCRNFMCHAKLRIKLGPLINFIIGHNGSGKSAVLTALTLCLGAKATSTNRGSSLKNFIKEGEESAMLSVKIKNQGEMAYQPETFGESIIVERHFNRAGSSQFKIKNAEDRVVSTKRADLEDLLDYLALQLDNPMNVLTQDMARQFLSNSSAHDKYKFFIRGTQLEQLDRDYRVMEDYLNNSEAKLYDREQDVQVLGKKATAAEDKKKLIDRSNTIRQKIYEYRWMHAWAQVEEVEQEIASYMRDLDKADEVIEEKVRDSEAASDVYAQHHHEWEIAEGVKTDLENELIPYREQQATIKERFDAHKKELIEGGAVRRNIMTDLKTAKDEIVKTKRLIGEEQARIEGANGPAHSRRLAELDVAKADAEHRRRERDDADKAPLERDRTIAQQKLESLRRERDDSREAITRVETAIRDLRKDQGGSMQNFNANLRNLMRAIQDETRFREVPVGPVGMHVRLLKPEWSSIVERVLGGNLEAFVVTNKHDQGILSELQRRTNCHSQILIGDSRPIDTTQHEPDQNQDTILRILNIDNDLVRNQLIINQGIDQTVLIRDRTTAFQYMTGGHPPANVKATICMHDTKRGQGIRIALSRTGAAQSGPVQAWDRKLRMKSDVDSQIRMQEDNLTQAKREAGEVETRIREAQQALELAKQACVRFEREQKGLRLACQQADDKVEQLQNAIEDAQVDAGKLDALKDQLREAQDSEAQHSNSYQDAIDARDRLNEVQHEVKAELDAIDAQIQERQTKITKLEKRMVKLADVREKTLREKNRAHGLIEVAREDRAAIEDRKNRAEQILNDEILPGATEIHPRVAVEPGLTAKIIDDKLEKLGEERRKFESRAGGTREEVVSAWAKAVKEFRQAKKDHRTLASLVTGLKRTLYNRKGRWRQFRRHITARAKTTFIYLLSERAFRGRIIVQHDVQEMDISVEPDMAKSSDKGRQTKTLSGGEKSFSTICLLLSIWEAMGSPIRCLDEFDVFMDNVNRDISMKMMIQAARRSVGRQFILITPQAMGNVQLGGDVKIHKMSDPERGQTALNFGN